MQAEKAARGCLILCFLALVGLAATCSAPPIPTTSAPSAQFSTSQPATHMVTWTASPSATSVPTLTPTQTDVAPTPTPSLSILQDLAVRQAIISCTDKQALFSANYPLQDFSQEYLMESFLPSNHPNYSGDEAVFMHYPYDPQIGKQALKQAGWVLSADSHYRQNAAGERLSLNLTTTQAEFRKNWVAVFTEQMKDCGIEILPSYLPAEEFFGNGEDDPGKLGRRNFELVAFGWVTQPDSYLSTMFRCDQVPIAENHWQGENFFGWCNDPVQAALQQLNSSLESAVRDEAYQVIQQEYSQDLPGVPLFTRVELNAADPELENFLPNPSELYTWNAAEWSIPGKDQIVMGLSAEPSSLFPLDTSYVSKLIQALVYGLDYTNLDYDFQPVTLKQLPSIENGLAINAPVVVSQGEAVIDANNQPVQLELGVNIYTLQGEEITYTGGSVDMQRLIVEFQFDEHLFWSDGQPVVREDYELAYRILCDPASGANEYLTPLQDCNKIGNVNFASDSSYVITWKPGYNKYVALLPPFGRLPAHQELNNGKKLSEAEPSQWTSIEEIMHKPLGTGPYTVSQWEYGKLMVLVANPFYFLGAPATETIVVKFIPIDAGLKPVTLIEQDAVDLIGFDSLYNLDVTDEVLFTAQEDGKVGLYPTAANFYEQIIFRLSDQ
jgi:ABC-type transport system substrate-binding protein